MRAIFSGAMFSTKSDRYATPQHIYNELNKEFQFNFDPCPLDGEANGLSTLFVSWAGKRVFCNPPYGNGIEDWIKRGHEAECSVFLLPARTDVRWFHELVLPFAKEIRFIKGRLKFGSEKYNAPFPSMIVVFLHD
jgi:hypothetical protein